ncbi:MAG: Gfo/Idh/MocA family oxidoreductase [Planctomycetota bacterium]
MNRRELLLGASVAGAGALLSGGRVWAKGQSPNEKLDVAVIACGGRGAANLGAVAATENIVALCDVDERRAGGSFEKFPKAKKYHDYRRLLDEMENQIDAVVVSTPNHVHAPASVTAMRMGKHAYCEKPLSHSIHEARVAAQVAAEMKVATQMGTQIHASANFRRVVELIRAGAIGPVRRCHIWLRGGGSAGDRPAETPPVPEGLNWDLWLGPAPYRPYHPCYVPHDWHYWWDFGGGAYGNMGCHYLDLAFWALKLRHPTTIEGTGSPVHPESTPKQLHVRYEFAAREEMPPVTVTWSHGPEGPAIYDELPKREARWAWGVFVGDDGMLLANYPQHALLPEEKFADFKPPEPTIPDSVGHHQEWIQACKTGSPTTCNFDYSGAVTEAVLLGNLAYRVGTKLEWDPVNLKFPNCPKAEEYLQREYREGWTL